MAMGSRDAVVMTQPSPRGFAIQLELLHSALASGLRPSARTSTPRLVRSVSRLGLAAAAAEVRDGGGAQLGIEPTDRLGDAGPAVVVRPARGLPPEPGALGGIAEQAFEALGQGDGIALGHEVARRAGPARGLHPAPARGHAGAA